ncbi:MAG TPA: hypothetical protein ENK85_09280 [Saprospiraceae bacterium]|nr:hypothetical protein [Saprospiraceae bacterium]
MAKKFINPLDPYLKKLPPFFKNRYVLVIAFFLAFMVFFDKHDLLTQYKLQHAVDQLEEDKTFYQEKIKETKQKRLDFEKNQEKYAREKYYVKKPKEEVFVIEEY